MISHNTDSKRIAKNTIILYVRMLFLMLISLYTSRVVLNALGVDDFGIYNAVGGAVAAFSVLSASFSTAISRFITFELGTGEKIRLKNVFSTSVSIQALLALLIVLVAETAGLWFLNEKMVIPADRMTAANWCYQFFIATLVLNLISVPYNAAIIAHERMSAFAYISLLEGGGKLLVAWLIVINPIDRLIFFSAMVAGISWMIRMIYNIYCKRHFEECIYHFILDKELLRQMFGFIGWNFIGSSSAILRDHGGNILINLFFGPSVNAARGISVQVTTAVTQFTNNFMMALNPQITKSYASKEYGYMFQLMFRGARFSYYILFLLSLPIILNTHYILVLWLKLVPEHTVPFVQLALVFAMSESISNPLVTAQLATGKIRNYQILVGGLQSLNFPLTFLLFYIGGIPEMVMIVAIIISQLCLAARLFMLKGMIGLNVRSYLKEVYIRILAVSVLAAIIPTLLCLQITPTFFSFLLLSVVCVLSTLLVEAYIGCNETERLIILEQVKKVMHKFRNRQ